MPVDNLVELLLSAQKAIVYLETLGIEENAFILDDILELLGVLKGAMPESRGKYDEIMAKFNDIRKTHVLPEDISEQFQAWGNALVNESFAQSLHEVERKNKGRLTQNKLDLDFDTLLDKIKDTGTDQLITEASGEAMKLRDSNKSYHDLLAHWYRQWYRIESFKADDQSFIRYFGNMYNYLKNNLGNLRQFYNKLCDNRSRYSLLKVMENWLSFSPDLRYSGVEHTFAHYFDLDLIECTPEEVFVDCGAFIGDSAKAFIEAYGTKYKRIYAYELTPKTYQKLLKNLRRYENVVCRNVGVSDKAANMTMLDVSGSEAGNRLSEHGNYVAQVVSLDEDIKEDITFIKMDIEGAEPDALFGAKNHIRRSHPKLAISLYHALNHLLDIPRIIHKIDPSYEFYFRHSGGFTENGDIPFPTEYVLIAL